jgi:uncharacterized protein (DUF1778 family)
MEAKMRKRPKGASPRGHLIGVKLSDSELKLIEDAASAKELKPSSFMAIVALREATKMAKVNR